MIDNNNNNKKVVDWMAYDSPGNTNSTRQRFLREKKCQTPTSVKHKASAQDKSGCFQ